MSQACMSGRMWLLAAIFSAPVLAACAGCNTRTLEWQAARGAAEAMGAARKVAVVTESGPTLDPAVAELMRRGYTVALLSAEPCAGGPKAAVPASGPSSRPAKRSRGLKLLKVPRWMESGAGGASRYLLAARRAGADLLVEVSTDPVPDVVVSLYVVVGVIRFQERVRDATLRISETRGNAVVGVVQVRYESPQRSGIDIMKDAFLGVDKIRQGEAPGRIKLTGKPGEPLAVKPQPSVPAG